MKLSFCDFWDGWQDHNNFFLDLFKSINPSVELSGVEECDILIYSCFGNRHKTFSKKNKIKIFYTGENLRPDYNDCNYSFTFDFDDYDGKNVRIPLWLMHIDWFNKKDYGNPKYVIPYDEIYDNEFIRTPKDKFCCTVFSSIKPDRVEMYQKLSQYKKVDGYGKPFGNWTSGEEAKMRILSNYKFSICFENTVYPGYFTEKLIHAKVAGTIPIYSGDLRINEDFNEKAFINLQKCRCVDDLVMAVQFIEENDDLYKLYKAEKLFNIDPKIKIEQIKDQIKTLLKL